MSTQPNNTIQTSIDFQIDPEILSKVEEDCKKKEISLSQAVKLFFEDTYHKITLTEEEEQEKHLLKYYGITSEQLHKESDELINDPNTKWYDDVDELFRDCLEVDDYDDEV